MKDSNYLISLRNDTGDGTPGTDFSSTTYIQIDPNSDDYNLKKDQLGQSKWVQDIITIANNGPVIVFVHGFHNDSKNIVELHNNVKEGLADNFKTNSFALISFDWPSSTKIAVYTHDWNNVKKSGPILISGCIELLMAAGIPSAKIHILTHSMGGRVAEAAFEITPPSKRIGHVMLTAADIDATHYDIANNSIILTNFVNHSTSFTSYHSANDLALKYSCKHHSDLPQHGETRLGQIGFNKNTTDGFTKCLDISCCKYYEDHVQKIDSSSITSHKWYLMPEFDLDFMQDVYNVLIGSQDFPNRSTTVDKGRYLLNKPNKE
ncbi:MAG: esterase/lipase superfamily enzyme [Aureispira sp.]|jgi:esterase/lipase superfamily enzyme